MVRNAAVRSFVFAAFALFASACALNRGPEPIPADEVLATQQQPAPGEVALGEEFHAAGVGADNLRGFLSAD